MPLWIENLTREAFLNSFAVQLIANYLEKEVQVTQVNIFAVVVYSNWQWIFGPTVLVVNFEIFLILETLHHFFNFVWSAKMLKPSIRKQYHTGWNVPRNMDQNNFIVQCAVTVAGRSSNLIFLWIIKHLMTDPNRNSTVRFLSWRASTLRLRRKKLTVSCGTSH